MIQDLLNVLPQLTPQEHAALIITLETAGGTLTCAENIMGWVDHLYRRLGCPVVAVIEERCLSAGLAVAARCDHVIAQPSAMIGAFGVMMTWPGENRLRAQLGLLATVYKTAALKDFGSPHRPPTPEDDAAIHAVLQDIHGQFADLIRDRRGIGGGELDEIFDGRLITGRRALEIGLIDQLGGFETAMQWLNTNGVSVGEPPYTLVFLGNASPSGQSSGGVLELLRTLVQAP
jgi:protease-4